MSFLSKLKEAFSKKEDKAQYLAGFQKTNETFPVHLLRRQSFLNSLLLL